MHFAEQCLSQFAAKEVSAEECITLLERARAEAGILNPLESDLMRYQDELAKAKLAAKCQIGSIDLQQASLQATKHLNHRDIDTESLADSLSTVVNTASKAKKNDDTPSGAIQAAQASSKALVQFVWL